MVGEMSGRENILVGKCPVGEASAGEVSVGEVSVGEVSVEDLSSGNCQSGNCPTIIVIRPKNVYVCSYPTVPAKRYRP